MNTAADENWVPAFAAGVKFRYDPVRKAWVILAPERIFLPDEQAVAVLHRVDGRCSVGAIVDVLAAQYLAPRDVIAADVTAMLRGLANNNVVRPRHE